MEAVFAHARSAETSDEELLVDDGWNTLEVGPEMVAVNVNRTIGNHESFGIGPEA